MKFSTKKMGVNFFPAKKTKPGGGSEGSLVKDHTFAAFFLCTVCPRASRTRPDPMYRHHEIYQSQQTHTWRRRSEAPAGVDHNWTRGLKRQRKEKQRKERRREEKHKENHKENHEEKHKEDRQRGRARGGESTNVSTPHL